MPPWAKVLLDGMVFIMNELKNVETYHNKINDLETTNATLTAKTQVLEDKIDDLQHNIERLELIVDDHEQRNRNFCLLLHGVAENEKEDTNKLVIDSIQEHLDITIELENIQRSHRLGPPRKATRVTRNSAANNTSPKTRPIIVRFRDFAVRQEIYKNKKKLKGKKISITENLTKKRYQLYQLSMRHFGKNNTWTTEGRITTKVNNNFVIISTAADLSKYPAVDGDM